MVILNYARNSRKAIEAAGLPAAGGGNDVKGRSRAELLFATHR